jgi:hypothetical protein
MVCKERIYQDKSSLYSSVCPSGMIVPVLLSFSVHEIKIFLSFSSMYPIISAVIKGVHPQLSL